MAGIRLSAGTRRLLVYLVVVSVVVLVADMAVGLVMRRLTDSGWLGSYHDMSYILDESTDRTVVFGSSVAQVGIRPDIIESRVGGSCHNAAMGFQNMNYHLVMLQSLLKRHVPERVLLGIDRPGMHMRGPGDNISVLYPFYGKGHAPVDSLLEIADPSNRWKLHFNMLRYNAGSLFKSFSVATPDSLMYQGFVGRPPSPVPLAKARVEWREGCAPDQLAALESFLSLCDSHDIQVSVFMPPTLTDDQEYAGALDKRQIRDVCHRHGIEFLDYTADPEFRSHPEWFADHNHLSAAGASVFSRRLCMGNRADSVQK